MSFLFLLCPIISIYLFCELYLERLTWLFYYSSEYNIANMAAV